VERARRSALEKQLYPQMTQKAQKEAKDWGLRNEARTADGPRIARMGADSGAAGGDGVVDRAGRGSQNGQVGMVQGGDRAGRVGREDSAGETGRSDCRDGMRAQRAVLGERVLLGASERWQEEVSPTPFSHEKRAASPFPIPTPGNPVGPSSPGRRVRKPAWATRLVGTPCSETRLGIAWPTALRVAS